MVKRKLPPRSGCVALRQFIFNLLILQFNFAAHDFLYLYTHIGFSVNKPNFHFKGKGRISTDGFNQINLSMLQFNILNFQIKQFIIFQKFSWNSV